MSTMSTQSAARPVSLVHQNTPDRWRRALERARSAQVKVFRLDSNRFAVTSAHDPGRAYEVTRRPEGCTCPAAQAGDPVCLHRAAVRAALDPDPEPPEAGVYDPDEEALRWAYNDRARAFRDLERYNRLIRERGRLSDADYRTLLHAQEREQDAAARIAELTAKLTRKAVAA